MLLRPAILILLALSLLTAGKDDRAMAVTTARPRLLVDADGVAQLRALVNDSVRTVYGFAPKTQVEAILNRAKALAAAPTYHYSVKIPAANGEHAGWDWAYTLSAKAPPKHDESKHYPPWTAMFQERSDSLTTRLKHFLVAWLLTGEQGYYDKAHEIVFCLTKWPQWTDPSYGGSPSCLDTGHCTQAVALFYDWCHDQLTEAEQAEVRQALIDKGIEPIRATFPKLTAYHNFWAVIDTGFGMAALALCGDVPEAEAWVAEAVAHAAENYDVQGSDGGSYEGPMYGTYAADQLAFLLLSLQTSRVATKLLEHPFLQTLPRFACNGLSPHLHGIPTFGDGGFTAGYPLTMAALANQGDEAARHYLVTTGHLAGIAGLNELFFYGPLLSAETLPSTPSWLGPAAFVDIGYAFLRGRGAEPFLAFKCGPPAANVGHNHYDQNSFQMTAFHNVLAADPGYRSYFDPPRRRYTTSTLGHNTIVVDLDDDYLASDKPVLAGHDQVKLTGGKLTELLPSTGIGLVAGDAAAAYNTADAPLLTSFLRRIIALPPHGFVIHDELTAPHPHRYSFLLHGPGGSEVAQQGDTADFSQPGALLQAAVYSPGGVTWRAGSYPGAENHGPYAAATTAEPSTSASFTAALLARTNPELVSNPGFEDGLNGWRIRDVEGQGPNHSASDARAHRGEQSGRIAGAGYLYSSYFSLPASSEFTVTVQHLTEGATKGGELVVYYWRGGKSFASERAARTPSEGQWTPLTLHCTVPAKCDQICIALNYFDSGVGYFDEVRIDGAEEPEASTPARIAPLGEGASEGLTIDLDGWTHLLSYGSHGRLQTDGRLAVVSIGPDGQLVRAMLDGGTRLALDGREICHTRQSCSVALERTKQGWESVIRTDLAPHAPAAAVADVGLVITAE